MRKTVVLVYMSLLISMNVLLTHIVPVLKIDTIRISFGFVPVAFSSMLFGPVIGGIGATLGDIIGMIIAPKGPYFPGLTFSALLTGVIYGVFLYKKPKTTIRIGLAVLCVTVFVDILLNTYWLTFILGQGYLAMLPARIIKSAIMLPVQVIIINVLWSYVGKNIKNISSAHI